MIEFLELPDFTSQEFREQFNDSTTRILRGMWFRAAEHYHGPFDPTLGFLFR